MTITELINESHSLAKEKGFWDIKKNPKEDIMFIMANIGNVLKSHKKGKFSDWILYNEKTFEENGSENKEVQFNNYFKVFIKDSFEDELANVVIRITDFFGGHNIDITKNNEWLKDASDISLDEFFSHTLPTAEYPDNVGEWLERAIAERCFHANEYDHGLLHILFYIGTLIGEFNVDIERHIIAKLAYNKSRPRLYGRTY